MCFIIYFLCKILFRTAVREIHLRRDILVTIGKEARPAGRRQRRCRKLGRNTGVSKIRNERPLGFLYKQIYCCCTVCGVYQRLISFNLHVRGHYHKKGENTDKLNFLTSLKNISLASTMFKSSKVQKHVTLKVYNSLTLIRFYMGVRNG
jgi:hypothetical protein